MLDGMIAIDAQKCLSLLGHLYLYSLKQKPEIFITLSVVWHWSRLTSLTEVLSNLRPAIIFQYSL